MRKNLPPVRCAYYCVVFIILNLTLSGCMSIHPVITDTETGNKNITVDNLLKIHKGESTEPEIKEIFGEPDSVIKHPDGSTTWMYLYTKTQQSSLERSPFQIDQTQLEIVFNSKGIVTEYVQTVSNRERKSQ